MLHTGALAIAPLGLFYLDAVDIKHELSLHNIVRRSNPLGILYYELSILLVYEVCEVGALPFVDDEAVFKP